MNKNSSLVGPAVAALVALLAGCSEETALPAYAEQLAYREDGRLVVFTPAGIMVHDAELAGSGPTISLDRNVGGILIDEPRTFALSETGGLAAVTFSNTEVRDVEVYDTKTGQVRLTLDVDTGALPVQGVALAPDGARMFVRADHWGMFDVESGELLWGAESPDGDCCGLIAPLFSRDGQVLFGFSGTRLEARRALTGEPVFSVETGSAPGFSGTLARSGIDGVLVGTRSVRDGDDYRQSYVFWSEADGSVVREVAQLPGRSFVSTFTGTGGTVACSPLGDVCASSLGAFPVTGLSAPPEHSVAIWTSDGTLLHELPAYASSLAFSSDGTQLALAGGEAEVYRIEDGALLGSASYRYDSY